MKNRDKKTGLKLLTLVAGAEVVAGFVADWNRTHLFNPRWTPHAKFHDALSIIMASMNGLLSLYLLYKEEGKSNLLVKTAAMVAAIPCMAMGMAYSFPGAKGLEAEFPKLIPRIGRVWLSEWVVCATGLPLLALGYILYTKKPLKKDLRLFVGQNILLRRNA